MRTSIKYFVSVLLRHEGYKMTEYLSRERDERTEPNAEITQAAVSIPPND